MNWGGASVAERVDLLVGRIVALLEACHLPTTIAAAGVPRAEFEAALPELIQAACDDISMRSNPRNAGYPRAANGRPVRRMRPRVPHASTHGVHVGSAANS